MLTLLLFPVLLSVFLLVGLLTWHLRILLGLVLNLTLPVSSIGRMVLVLVGTLLSAVPMRWLRRMLALLLIGVSLPTFLLLHALALMLGWLMLLARRCVSRSGLLVGWILLKGLLRRLLVLSRMSGMYTGRSMGWFLLRLCLLLGMRSPGLLWMIFGLLGS